MLVLKEQMDIMASGCFDFLMGTNQFDMVIGNGMLGKPFKRNVPDIVAAGGNVIQLVLVFPVVQDILGVFGNGGSRVNPRLGIPEPRIEFTLRQMGKSCRQIVFLDIIQSQFAFELFRSEEHTSELQSRENIV